MRLILAAASGTAGIVLLVWTAVLLGWRRWLDLDDAAPAPEHPPLVLAGPFGATRNPQTLGLLLCLLAIALFRPRAGLYLATMLAGGAALAVAAAEERRLEERFGEAYRRYRRAVPFLLPWGG